MNYRFHISVVAIAIVGASAGAGLRLHRSGPPPASEAAGDCTYEAAYPRTPLVTAYGWVKCIRNGTYRVGICLQGFNPSTGYWNDLTCAYEDQTFAAGQTKGESVRYPACTAGRKYRTKIIANAPDTAWDYGGWKVMC